MKQFIERLRQLEAAATPGEWRPFRAEYWNGAQYVYQGAGPRQWGEPGTANADADLIAEMRNALPQLLDRLERLEAVVEAAKARVVDYDRDLRIGRHIVMIEAMLQALEEGEE